MRLLGEGYIFMYSRRAVDPVSSTERDRIEKVAAGQFPKVFHRKAIKVFGENKRLTTVRYRLFCFFFFYHG